jgi:hypothetical protein
MALHLIFFRAILQMKQNYNSIQFVRRTEKIKKMKTLLSSHFYLPTVFPKTEVSLHKLNRIFLCEGSNTNDNENDEVSKNRIRSNQ